MFEKTKGKSLDIALSGLLILAGLFIFGDLFSQAGNRHIAYSALKAELRQGALTEVALGPEFITGTLKSGETIVAQRPGSDDTLFQQLDQAGVTYGAASGWRSVFYGYVAPALLLGSCLLLYNRRRSGSLKAFGKRGKSIMLSDYPDVSFDEVAGCDEAKHDLAEMVAAGHLTPQAMPGRAITYHDPCYLGRYNGEIEAPRALLDALGLDRREMARSGKRSMCCGGGGGAPSADIPGDTRIPDIRMGQAKETGATTVAVACPQCTAMLEGVTGERPEVKDVAELLWEAVQASASTGPRESRQAKELEPA